MIMLRDKKTSAEKSYWLPLPLPQFFTPLQQCRYTNKTLSTCNWDVKYVNSLYLVLSFIVNIIWLSMHPSKLISGTIYLVLNCIFLIWDKYIFIVMRSMKQSSCKLLFSFLLQGKWLLVCFHWKCFSTS